MRSLEFCTTQRNRQVFHSCMVYSPTWRVDVYGKCREIYLTWLWVCYMPECWWVNKESQKGSFFLTRRLILDRKSFSKQTVKKTKPIKLTTKVSKSLSSRHYIYIYIHTNIYISEDTISIQDFNLKPRKSNFFTTPVQTQEKRPSYNIL